MPGEAAPWSVYVLACTTHSGRTTVHVGIAKNVSARVRQHQAGRVKATRGREITLLGHSPPMTQGDALRMETALKLEPPGRKRAQAAAWRSSGE